MAKRPFWTSWKRKSDVEKRAIQAVLRAQKILLERVPENKLVAIYIKGSFVRREMLPTSDIDIVPIVNDNRYLNKIITLDKEKRHLYSPAELLPLSLWELKNRQRYPNRNEKGPKGAPSIDQFSTHKLIWGEELDPAKYPSRTKSGRLKGLLGAFKNTFLPLYEQKQLGFNELVKQVFWLTDLEQHILGKNPPHNWKKLAETSLKNHIVRDAWKLRNSKNIMPQEKNRFLNKLRRYIKNLEMHIQEPNMHDILSRGELAILLPEGEGGGLSGEVHLIRHNNQKYVVRRCQSLKTAKFYEFVSKELEKYAFMPKFLGRSEKDVLYEYIEGRDLREKERAEIFTQLGIIGAHVNQVPAQMNIDVDIRQKLRELVTGRYTYSIKVIMRRKLSKISQKPESVLTRDDANATYALYAFLKKKTRPEISLDIADFVPGNFRLRNRKVYLVDIESIKPNIKGAGTAKFRLKWGKSLLRQQHFKKGYQQIASMKFLNETYFYCNFIFNCLIFIFSFNWFLRNRPLLAKRSAIAFEYRKA